MKIYIAGERLEVGPGEWILQNPQSQDTEGPTDAQLVPGIQAWVFRVSG